MMCKAKAWVLALAAGLLLLLIPAQARADVTRLLILNDEQTSETSAAATDVLRRFARYSSWTCTFVSSEDVPDTDGYTAVIICTCLLYTSPSPRDGLLSRMPSSA